MKDKLKVLVGIPSGSHWLAQFGVDLTSLVAYFANRQVPGWRSQELRVANVRSSMLPKNRMDIMKAARSLDVDYLLFLDSDHTFPADLLHRLIAHDKPVVALNCVTKTLPAQTTARTFKLGNPQGEIVYSDSSLSGLQRVWRVGTGVMLLRKSVIEQIPNSAWNMVYREDKDTYQGEDWAFCAECERLGIPIYVDHALSRKVGHVGNLEYTHDYVGEVVRG